MDAGIVGGACRGLMGAGLRDRPGGLVCGLCRLDDWAVRDMDGCALVDRTSQEKK